MKFVTSVASLSPGYPSGDGRRISGDSMSQQQQQQPVNIFTPNYAQPASPSAMMNNPGKLKFLLI
jgi:hypothetical protein